jgi:hypothetical protein
VVNSQFELPFSFSKQFPRDVRKVSFQSCLDHAFVWLGVSTVSAVRSSRIQALFGLTLAIFVLSGCGDQKVGTVSGTVTLDGEPIERASVLYEPEKGGRPSFAVTDAYGRYKLAYSRTQNGAEVGDCIVKITKLQETPAEGDKKTQAKAPAADVKIPERYAREPVKVTVLPKHNTIDIELTTEP